MSDKSDDFYFDGVRVVDSQHYEMLKELYYNDSWKSHEHKEYERRRSLYATAFVHLSQLDDSLVSDEYLLKLYYESDLHQLLPEAIDKLDTAQKQQRLELLLLELDRMVASWVEPKLPGRVPQYLQRLFKYLLQS